MHPIVLAIRQLKVDAPNYFRGLSTTSRLVLPRPSILTDMSLTWRDTPVTTLALPTCMFNTPLAVWRERYNDYAVPGRSPADIQFDMDDLANACGMNDRVRHRFFPKIPVRHGLGLNLLLAFTLAGAATSGALITKLDGRSFMVMDPETKETWGANDRMETTQSTLLHVLHYRAYMEGSLWRGSTVGNRKLIQAYSEARRNRDKTAMALLAGLYWNIVRNPDLNRIL